MRTLALSSAALLLADRTQIRMSANAQLRLCEAQPQRTLLEACPEVWRLVVEIHLTGTYLFVRAVLPTMQQQHEGTIEYDNTPGATRARSERCA